MPKNKKADGSKSSQNSDLLIHVLTGSAVSSISFFLFLLTGAALILKLDLDSGSMFFVVLACAIVSSMLGGFTAVRKTRKNGALLGALSTVPSIAAIIISAFIAAKSSPGINMLSTAAAMIIFGAVGGILAVNLRKKTVSDSPRKRGR